MVVEYLVLSRLYYVSTPRLDVYAPSALPAYWVISGRDRPAFLFAAAFISFVAQAVPLAFHCANNRTVCLVPMNSTGEMIWHSPKRMCFCKSDPKLIIFLEAKASKGLETRR
jgi:hypothetical protein